MCHGVARLSGPSLGVWALAPAMLVFWGSIAGLVAACGGAACVRRWTGPVRTGRAWAALAVGVGLLSLHEFLSSASVLADPLTLATWLGFGLVNPWFEEGYWRGVLLDATEGWPFGLGVVYSTVLFALSHPFIWGVHSVAMRHPNALVGLGLVGLVWGVAARQSRSLRPSIAGHMLSNLLGLSAPVLQNLHVPEALSR